MRFPLVWRRAMNEFIEQFIIESRELIEQAMSALGTLEHTASDAENLDALFRAIHTLKGGAGIVEFRLWSGLFTASKASSLYCDRKISDGA